MGTKSSHAQFKPSPERFVVRIDPMPDRLPPDWDPMQIAREGGRGNVLGAEILCWQRIEDDRPWRVDSILLCGHFRRSTPGVRSSTFDVWCLTWLFCHPHIDKVWMPSTRSWPTGPARYQEYFEPPGGVDVLRFVQDFDVDLIKPPGFRLLDSGLCTHAWCRAFGEEPPEWIRGYF